MKRCSLLIIREMQIKTMRYHLKWSEWLSSKYSQTTNAGEREERREPFHTVGGKVIWYSHNGEKHLVNHFSHVCFAIPWTASHHAPVSMGFSIQSSRGSSQPRDGVHVSYVLCIGRRVLYHQDHQGSLDVPYIYKNRFTIWPCNPTPGHISREKHDLKGYMHPNVHCSTVYNSQDMEAT